MVGKVYCEMLTLKKGEDPTGKSWKPVHIGSWMTDGDLFIEITDERDKSIIISMSPELMLALVQKASREEFRDSQVRLDLDGSDVPTDSDPKLGIGKSLKSADPKIAIV